MKRQSSAGDTKSFRIIKSKADHELLHKELAALRKWMMKWKRKSSFADERIECWEKHLFMPVNSSTSAAEIQYKDAAAFG